MILQHVKETSTQLLKSGNGLILSKDNCLQEGYMPLGNHGIMWLEVIFLSSTDAICSQDNFGCIL